MKRTNLVLSSACPALILLVGICFLGDAHADITTVPPGLQPGDQYRLVFITKDKIFQAESSSIDAYDSWVTAQANTSPDLVALGTTWRVIGSTSSVSAKFHTDTDDSPAGLNGVPIYRLDGAMIASSYDDLWDGSIQNPLYVAQDGTVLDTCCGTWTGTSTAGIAVPGNELGAGPAVVDGAPNGTGANWIQTGPFGASNLQYLYAISDVLTMLGPGDLDPLEDIGPDGTPVTTRTIGGVAVTISTASGKSLEARTYFDPSPNAFGGAGGSANAPANPGNISLTRFISTVDRAFTPDNWAFGQVAPIIFDFSTPVQRFGLTTIDLLEGNGSLTFRAYDADGNVVAEQTRSGPQGGSGLDLDWQVSAPNIVQVQLLGTIADGVGGYGIDDLILEADPTKIVSINVRPGSDAACNGVIPVAILGSDTLDVTQIDQTTLSFDGLTVRVRGNGSLSCSIRDTNGDGYADLVCQYQDTLTEGTLTGDLLDGTPIQGTDTVCVLH